MLSRMIRHLRDMSALGKTEQTLQLRLFGFLLLFLCTIMLGLLIILLLAGVFDAGRDQSRGVVENELSHLTSSIDEAYGTLSLQSVVLSEALSKSLESELAANNLQPADLKAHPEVAEALIEKAFPQIKSALERAKSSGAYLILDTSLNPDPGEAQNSRAGLYNKNMEPNIISSASPYIMMFRGPAAIARKDSINLHSLWAMEFDTEDAAYFSEPMAQDKSIDKPLSRRYYWCPTTVIPGTSEELMLCAAPLLASDGTVFGVCGFEVSAMLFKLANTPDNSAFNRIFILLAPLDSKGGLEADKAFVAGSWNVNSTDLSDSPLAVQGQQGGFNTYVQRDGKRYVGLDQHVTLYPEGSVYSGAQWAAAVLIPEADLAAKLRAGNLKLLILLLLLLILSVAASVFISRKYISPVLEGLDRIRDREKGLGEAPRTRIQEIDDLIEFLAARDEAEEAQPPGPDGKESPAAPNSAALFTAFTVNVETLSPAERAVFDLYLEGHTAREIADILCLSINTIKTHNTRIYNKLGVTSRKELMLYIQMMGEDRFKKADSAEEK